MLEYLTWKKLSQSRKNRNFKIIRKGNCILNAHSNRIFGNKKRRTFRKKLFNGELIPSENGISGSDMQAINAVRFLEIEMLEGFANLLKKIASRWWILTQHFTGVEEDDYGSEVVIAFFDALYSYGTGKSSKVKGGYVNFSTFLWKILNNRMVSFVAKQNMLGGLYLRDFIAAGKFEKLRVAQHDKTYDEVVEQAGLTTKQIGTIEGCFTQVISESQLQADQASPLHRQLFGGGDYTALAVDYKNYKAPLKLDVDMRDAIESAFLSEFERDLLATSLRPYCGWQSDVAKRHTNPITGNPYSRRAPAVCLPKVYEKIRDQYELVA